MASRTSSDRGVDNSQITFRRADGVWSVRIIIEQTDGTVRSLELTQAQLVANTTAPERTTLLAAFVKLYDAGKVLDGFA